MNSLFIKDIRISSFTAK